MLQHQSNFWIASEVGVSASEVASIVVRGDLKVAVRRQCVYVYDGNGDCNIDDPRMVVVFIRRTRCRGRHIFVSSPYFHHNPHIRRGHRHLS